MGETSNQSLVRVTGESTVEVYVWVRNWIEWEKYSGLRQYTTARVLWGGDREHPTIPRRVLNVEGKEPWGVIVKGGKAGKILLVPSQVELKGDAVGNMIRELEGVDFVHYGEAKIPAVGIVEKVGEKLGRDITNLVKALGVIRLEPPMAIKRNVLEKVYGMVKDWGEVTTDELEVLLVAELGERAILKSKGDVCR